MCALVVESVDTQDLKSCAGNGGPVQVWSGVYFSSLSDTPLLSHVTSLFFPVTMPSSNNMFIRLLYLCLAAQERYL